MMKERRESVKLREQKEAVKKEVEFKKEQALKPCFVSDKIKLDFKIYAKDKYRRETYSSILTKIRIVAYTSLSPSHHNVDTQRNSVESWHKLGMEIYSLNNPSEAESLKKIYPEYIKFIPTLKTSKHIFGKPYIVINAMIDHFQQNKTGDVLMLINSDIILSPATDLIKKIKSISEIGIIISSRNDYKNKFEDGKKYGFGFDVFFIHNKYANIFPPTIYSMGQTWWDYWVPYTALKNNIPVFRIEEKFAFHKEHPKQYQDKDWYRMTDYFKFENNIIESDYQNVNNAVWNDIITNSIVI